MKKRYITVTAALFLWMVFFCTIAGCQQKKEEKTGTKVSTKTVQKEKKEESDEQKERTFHVEKLQWQDEDMLPERIEKMFYKDETMYFIGKREGETLLYTMDMEGKIQGRKPVKDLKKYIEQFVTDGKGNYAMILTKNIYMPRSECFYAEYKEGDDGLEQTGIWEIEKASEITEIALDMEQAFVVYKNQNAEIYRKNDNGEFTNIDGNRKHIVVCGDDTYKIMADGETFWKAGAQAIEKWDAAENKRLEKIQVEGLNINNFFFSRSEQDDYSIFFVDQDGLHGCRKDGKTDLLLEWLANDISANAITGFAGNGKVFFARERNGEFFYRIAEGDSKDNVGNREIIIVATTEAADNVDFVMAGIEEFNQSQDQYWVRLSAYGKYENPEEKLLIDVATGQGPDMILVREENGDMLERLEKMDGLEDLYPYLDKDPELSREDFIESGLHLLEADGKLTKLAENFTIHAMIGRKDFIGDRKSWTWEEFEECCQEVPEGEYPYLGSNFDIFLDAFINTYPQYFDLKAGKVLVEEGGFDKAVSLTDPIFETVKDAYGNEVKLKEMLKKVQDGEIYVCSYSMSLYPFMLRPDFGEIQKEQDLALIGYPCNEGTGVGMSFGNQYMITSFSEHKEGAWQYLKSMMLKNYSCQLGNLPLWKPGYEFAKKCMLAQKDYIDEDGRNIPAIGGQSGYHVTEEDVEKVERLIELADCKTLIRSHPLRQIVEEELLAYRREENRTLDQAMDYIKSRAKIYLSERQ